MQPNIPATAAPTDLSNVRLAQVVGTQMVSIPASGLAASMGDEIGAVSYLTAQTLTPAEQEQARSNIGAALRGHIFGLTLSNNVTDTTNDIDIAAGEAASTEANPVLMPLATALTKRLDAAWAVGTNQGGLDTGSIANTTYHLFLIRRPDTGVVDVLFSASATSPTMPANYTQKRRIGSVVRKSGAILGFVQDGDDFMWKSQNVDVAANNPGTAAVTRTLTLPTGIRVSARITIGLEIGTPSTDSCTALFSDLSAPDLAPGVGYGIGLVYAAAGVMQFTGPVEVVTNTAAQIRSRISRSTAGTSLYINTLGYRDTRGRNA